MESAAHVEVRLACASDADAIARILYESFAAFESLYTPQGFAATTPDAGQVLSRMQEGPVWIAMLRTQPVGTAAAMRKSNSAYMRGMAVLPGARGSGVGAKLLAQVEHWALKEGCHRIFLSTTPFLSAAIALYENSGFRRTPDPPHHLFGTPLFTMEKLFPVAKL